MILAFDTSTALTSVAITDGAEVVAESLHLDARRHAEVLAPMLRDVLAEAGVGASGVTVIACGVGPGPYTGLRVGIATALAVGAAWDRPVVGVCSLDAIAAAARVAHPDQVLGVATDARRREVYWARYGADGTRMEGPLVNRPDELADAVRSGVWAGHGAHVHADAFGTVLGSDEGSAITYPHASWVGRLAHDLIAAGVQVAATHLELDVHGAEGAATSSALVGRTLLPPQPLYLRRPDAVASAPS